MGRERYIPRNVGAAAGEPFGSAEEAWLWFSRCQLARIEGVRPAGGMGGAVRPCDPDDIYRAVMVLVRRRVLAGGHLTVLGRFGARLAPPDPWADDTPGEAALWAEALDRLTTALRDKGIVA